LSEREDHPNNLYHQSEHKRDILSRLNQKKGKSNPTSTAKLLNNLALKEGSLIVSDFKTSIEAHEKQLEMDDV
jgi:hypothetical protein